MGTLVLLFGLLSPRALGATAVDSAIEAVNASLAAAADHVKAGNYGAASSALTAAANTLDNYAPIIAKLVVEERQEAGGDVSFPALNPLPQELTKAFYDQGLKKQRSAYKAVVQKIEVLVTKPIRRQRASSMALT